MKKSPTNNSMKNSLRKLRNTIVLWVVVVILCAKWCICWSRRRGCWRRKIRILRRLWGKCVCREGVRRRNWEKCRSNLLMSRWLIRHLGNSLIERRKSIILRWTVRATLSQNLWFLYRIKTQCWRKKTKTSQNLWLKSTSKTTILALKIHWMKWKTN